MADLIPAPPNLSHEMREMFSALALPLLGDQELLNDLMQILGEQDADREMDAAEEEQRVTVEVLFALCHGWEWTAIGWVGISQILVGGIAEEANELLRTRGCVPQYSAKRMSGILKELRLRTIRLGKHGRGLRFLPRLRQQVHELAARFGMTRRDISAMTVEQYGYGGRPCSLCDKYNLSGGLRFVEAFPSKRRITRLNSQKRRPLFSKADREKGIAGDTGR